MAPYETDDRAQPGRRRRRIYLIEEDPAERARAAELLAAHGYDVTVVPTLEAAFTQGFWEGNPARLLFVRRGRSGHLAGP